MEALLQDAIDAVAEELAAGPWDAPPVYLVVPDAAALHAEREILRRLAAGGSARLRVGSPARTAGALLRALSLPAPETLSAGALRAQVRVRAAAAASLRRIGLPPGAAPGAERRLSESVAELLWHRRDLPAQAAHAIGVERAGALSSLAAQLLDPALPLVPESVLYWRAADALQGAAGNVRVHWAVPQGLPALEALHEALRAAGSCTDWQEASANAPKDAPSPQVRVHSYVCRDLEDEARAAVLHCRGLLGAGVPAGEIAIGLADPALQPLLQGLFSRARIPVDRGAPRAQGQPLAECLSGLCALAAGGAQEEALLRILGSGLVPPPGERRDEILRQLRGLRPGAAEELLLLPQALLPGAADWPSEADLLSHLRHLDSWLRRLGLPQATGRLGEEAAAVQDQIWNAFWTLAQAAAQAASGLRVRKEVALRAIEDLLSAARPAESPRRGAIRVTDAEALSGAHHPHVLLLGLSETAFPARVGPQGILSAEQLAAAERAGVRLGRSPAVLRAEAEAQALQAVHSARQTLWLSAAARDADGRVQGFSPLAAEIAPPAAWSAPKAPGGGVGASLSPGEAGIVIASAIARRREVRADAGDLLPLAAAHAAAFGDGPHFAGFSPRQAEDPVGAFEGEIAVTALEQYGACRFLWLGGRLGLGREQPFDILDPRRRGTLVHRVLTDLPYDALEKGALEDAVRTQVTRAADADAELWMLRGEAGPRGPALREELAGEILRAARMLAAERRASAFHTVGREVAFGRGGALGPLEVPLPDGGKAALRGRIDRLEEAGDLLRVTDFKVRSRQTYDFSRIFHGIDLQVGAYLLAALRSAFGKGKRGAVAAYWPVRVGLRTPRSAAEPNEEERWKPYRQRGLFLGLEELVPLLDKARPQGASPFHPLALKADGDFSQTSPVVAPEHWPALERHLERTLGRLAAGVLAGEAEPNPYALERETACQGCDLLPVCRYEAGIEGYRRLDTVSQEALRDA